ncbi:MAG: ATPase, T2SS/T4P/T4SS family [Campylobacterota bacterium]|nr:ATPase, T2SS/T4P/T4SS family [Campylobacterota bacterium]
MSSVNFSLTPIIDKALNEKYDMKTGYEDIFSNEGLYKDFIHKLGYRYYDSYKQLLVDYDDITHSLPNEKKEICSDNFILTLVDKKTKNRVLGIRDVANTDFELLAKFYFVKIVILSDALISEAFGTSDNLTIDDKETIEDIDRYFNQIMSQAILLGASDIHIQKASKIATLWFRIDGIKVEIGNMKVSVAKTLKRKLVTLANQEDSDFKSINGIISYTIAQKETKFRLGIINSKFNFSITLRIIGGKMLLSPNLELLSYPKEAVDILENLTNYQNGMILITGQVGSGKTHLMYALLKRLSKKKQFIVTIENPVEYVDQSFFQIDLSEHESASEESKYGYPEAVVDILRQDSNIILIGETRDPQTAFQLVNASNLGQLVLSTMHTNSARATLSRMTSSLGIFEGDIIDELRGIVSQKLVRKLCPNCKKPDNEGGYLKVGCDECGVTGYKNRVPVVEIVRFNLGQGGDFDNCAEYLSLEDGCMLQYKAGYITKEDALSIIHGKELWYD